MGFHECAYCTPTDESAAQYSRFSSGDVTLTFASGRSWRMPDMILHYIADHGWQPPEAFIDDVVHSTLTHHQRVQTRSASMPTNVGYLHGPYERGAVPLRFVDKLQALMHQGMRLQSKGLYHYEN